MKKNGFTLPELLAVIAVLSIILAIAIPKVLDYYSSSRKSLFITSAKGIVRDVEYNNIDLKDFKTSRLIDLDIKDSNLYDLENSYMYVENNQLVLDLVGKGKYEGMYACGVTDSSTDNEVTNEPCDSINENAEVKFTVYLSDGVTTQVFNETYASNSELTLQEPTRNNYKFKEWVVIVGDATITGNTLKFGVKDTSIYARWDKAMVLTIDLNGGSVSSRQDGTYMSNTTIQLNRPTKNGYTFNKWDLEKGNSILSGDTLITGTQNSNLKATYNLNTYTISYTLNGGNATNPTSYNIETNTITLNNPAKFGYTFAGWTGSNGSTKQTTVTIPKGSTGDKSYTANYTGNKYTCAAGKYLRASDASCQPCPGEGVYCPGGTFTYNGSDQGKSNCPSGYNKSDVSASANTKCYISVTGGYYKTTSTGSTTAQCAVGSYSTAHNSYYNVSDSCTMCTNGTTTSAVGQTSCNANCNKTNVASWNTPGWNNNSPTNVCSPKTCATNYKLENGNCVINQITCAAGKYLRASDSSCQSCPGGGVYCPGGTFTPNGSDQGKSNCPSGYDKSDVSASANTGCYISVAGGYYKTASTGSTTSQCAVGSYSTTHNSYYNVSDSCTICQPSGAVGTNGTTSAIGQTSCNASCNKSNVASWNTASWNNNSPTNVCSIKTCASGYELYNGNCMLPATFVKGTDFNKKIIKLSGETSYSESITKIERYITTPSQSVLNSAAIVSDNGTIPIYAWFDNGTIYYYSTANKLYLNEDSSYMFRSLYNLSSLPDIGNLDTSKVKNANYMFSYTGQHATSFITDLSNWNTSNITDMSYMFNFTGHDATTFNIGNLSNWNVSNVTTMKNMFEGSGLEATTWSIGNISNWNVSSVTDMSTMFKYAGSKDTTWNIGSLSNWDVSNVITMKDMFWGAGYNAASFNLNLSNWNVSKVKDMSGAFVQIGRLSTTWSIGDLSNWDVSNVTQFDEAFAHAGENATTWNIGDLSNWNVSNVTSFSSMFSGAGENATTWNIGDLSNWNTSKATTMSFMFQWAGRKATTFNIGNLSNWDTTKVTSMAYMFSYAAQNSAPWNIGNLKIYAKNLDRMFNSCSSIKANVYLYTDPYNYSDDTYYREVFDDAATVSGSGITVNYKSTVTNINKLINTKSSNSNVVKGSVIN